MTGVRGCAAITPRAQAKLASDGRQSIASSNHPARPRGTRGRCCSRSAWTPPYVAIRRNRCGPKRPQVRPSRRAGRPWTRRCRGCRRARCTASGARSSTLNTGSACGELGRLRVLHHVAEVRGEHDVLGRRWSIRYSKRRDQRRRVATVQVEQVLRVRDDGEREPRVVGVVSAAARRRGSFRSPRPPRQRARLVRSPHRRRVRPLAAAAAGSSRRTARSSRLQSSLTQQGTLKRFSSSVDEHQKNPGLRTRERSPRAAHRRTAQPERGPRAAPPDPATCRARTSPARQPSPAPSAAAPHSTSTR